MLNVQDGHNPIRTNYLDLGPGVRWAYPGCREKVSTLVSDGSEQDGFTVELFYDPSDGQPATDESDGTNRGSKLDALSVVAFDQSPQHQHQSTDWNQACPKIQLGGWEHGDHHQWH